MEDEFNVDGAPDPSLWSYNIGTGSNGWGNNELQYYTDRPENISSRKWNVKNYSYSRIFIWVQDILLQEF